MYPGRGRPAPCVDPAPPADRLRPGI